VIDVEARDNLGADRSVQLECRLGCETADSLGPASEEAGDSPEPAERLLDIARGELGLEQRFLLRREIPEDVVLESGYIG
jgi:hypothetical protein